MNFKSAVCIYLFYLLILSYNAIIQVKSFLKHFKSCFRRHKYFNLMSSLHVVHGLAVRSIFQQAEKTITADFTVQESVYLKCHIQQNL